MNNGPLNKLNSLHLRALLYVIVLIALPLVIFWPGITGHFLFDDIANLSGLGKADGIHDMDSLRSYIFNGVTTFVGRPISLLSFTINSQQWPADPYPFKFTNIMIHLVNGLLIFGFLSASLKLMGYGKEKAFAIAFFAALIWAIHPIQISTVLYVVQRMAELVSLFIFAGLWCYMYGRWVAGVNVRAGYLWMSCAVVLFGLLAILSKENGILLPLLILIIEATLLNQIARPKGWSRWATVFIGIPCFAIVIYFGMVVFNSESYYAARDFTLYERLLTEARVLLDYLLMIVYPNTTPSIFNDNYSISRGLFSPISTSISLLIIAALLFVSLVYRKRWPIISFAILWFFGAHIIESSVIPLEIYFEHRNYLPLLGPAVAVAYYVNKLHRLNYRVYLPVTLILIASVSVVTLNYSNTWGDNDKLYAAWAKEHPDSIRVMTNHAIRLTQLGRSDEAIEILAWLKNSYSENLGVQITHAAIACSYNQLQKQEFMVMMEDIKVKDYDASTHSKINLLYKVIREGACIQIKAGGLNQLVLNATQNPSLAQQGTILAQLYTISADLNFSHKHYKGTLIALNKAFNANPNFETIIRLARMQVRLKQFSQARKSIALARQINVNRNPLLPSRSKELDLLEEKMARILPRTVIVNSP